MDDRMTLGVVDNDPWVASSLQRAIVVSGAPANVLWTALSASEAVGRCGKPDGTPQVLLTDLEMPGGGGYELAQELKPRFPRIVIVAMTAFELTHSVGELQAAGIATVIAKSLPIVELLGAVASAAGNAKLENWANRELAMVRPSEQELETIRLYAGGETTEAIARRLNVSESTVKTYMKRLFAKLDVHNRAEAIMACTRKGLL